MILFETYHPKVPANRYLQIKKKIKKKIIEFRKEEQTFRNLLFQRSQPIPTNKEKKLKLKKKIKVSKERNS